MGPSWYLMPDVFERFFGHFGREPSEFYELERLDPHYRVFWKDGDKVDVLPDREANKALFEEYEPGAGEAFKRISGGVRTHLRDRDGTLRVRGPSAAPRLRRQGRAPVLVGALASRQDAGTRRRDYFDHPKLQQLMQYTLVFLGGSPTNTPRCTT